MMYQKGIKENFFDVSIYIILTLIMIMTLYPFYNVLVISLNSGRDTSAGGVFLWPRFFTLENYTAFFADKRWITGLLWSVIRTLLGTGIGVMFTSIVAYALSFGNLKFRKTYMTIIIISMYFSGGIIPYYILLKQIGLINNFLVYLIPGALNLFFVIVGISFFQDISPALREAAFIDGANDLKIFYRVILPVSLPFLATMILFIGVMHWNNWFDSAFFMMGKPGMRTLSYLMMEVIMKTNVNSSLAGASNQSILGMRSSGVTTLSIQAAAMVVSILPIICVYPFLQKYFVKGIMLGSVKE